MVLESIIPLIIGLGIKFFVGFILGALTGWGITKSVYIGIGIGLAVGSLAFIPL